MDPDLRKTTSFDLPTPTSDVAPTTPQATANRPMPGPMVPPVPNNGLPAFPPLNQTNSSQPVTAARPNSPMLEDKAPDEANDIGLMPEEWVHKVDQAINNTKADPYRRAIAIGELKSEFQLSFYNRKPQSREE